MRTKTKILTAAIMAAGAASSMAQSNVYSLNIVGYVNVPVTKGKLYLLCNPFDDGAGDNISSIMSSLNTNASAFSGSHVYTYTPSGGYSPESYSATSPTTGIWGPGTNTLTPGKGFWFLPSGTGNVTFVGSVVLSNSVSLLGNSSQEINLVGSAYPASTNLVGLGMNWITNAGGGAAQSGDTIYRYSPTTGYTPYTFSAGFGWSGGAPNFPAAPPAGPTLNVAEGFWYENLNATSIWSQSFTVN